MVIGSPRARTAFLRTGCGLGADRAGPGAPLHPRGRDLLEAAAVLIVVRFESEKDEGVASIENGRNGIVRRALACCSGPAR